jgi:hypothetical protein
LLNPMDVSWFSSFLAPQQHCCSSH